MTSDEIIKLIAVCREAGVKKLVAGDVCLDFGQAIVEPIEQAPSLPEAFEPLKASTEQDEQDEEELLISDPLAFEEQFMKGDS